MKLIPIVTIAAAIAAIATPLAAQQTAPNPAYDQTAPITLEGTVDLVHWSQTQGTLILKAGPQTWDIALPASKTLLDKGISAEVLRRDVAVKVRAYKAKDTACAPDCKAQAIDLTVGAKDYALLG